MKLNPEDTVELLSIVGAFYDFIPEGKTHDSLVRQTSKTDCNHRMPACIYISTITRDRLVSLLRPNQTFDDVIKSLLDKGDNSLSYISHSL